MLQARSVVTSPHLLKTVRMHPKSEKLVCSEIHRLYILLEHPFTTMATLIHNSHVFPESELWSILFSCCNALNSMYKDNLPH